MLVFSYLVCKISKGLTVVLAYWLSVSNYSNSLDSERTHRPCTQATSPSDILVQSTPRPPSVEQPPQCSKSVNVSTHDPSQYVFPVTHIFDQSLARREMPPVGLGPTGGISAPATHESRTEVV